MKSHKHRSLGPPETLREGELCVTAGDCQMGYAGASGAWLGGQHVMGR